MRGLQSLTSVLFQSSGRSCIHKRSLPVICNTNNKLNSRSVMTIAEARQQLINVVGGNKLFSSKGKPGNVGLQSSLVDDQSLLEARSMTDSACVCKIPLSDEKFRQTYLNTCGTAVRFGVLMENLDSFAVLVSYEHNRPMLNSAGLSPLSIVTAMVDEMRILENGIKSDVDIDMFGNVTWAGKSSMEAGIRLEQEGKTVLTAYFVMVARNSLTGRAATVHPLGATSAEEDAAIALGDQRKVMRLNESKESLFEKPPTNEEKGLIHQMFVNTLNKNNKSFNNRSLPDDCVWLESTALKNAIVCFPEKRNIHNKIFGGYVMRKAYELAWANAVIFGSDGIKLLAVEDIIFHAPVPIGSILLMSSKVCCTEGNRFVLRVHADVLDPATGVSKTSNTFYYLFQSTTKKVPTVVPKTYGESMLYLDSLRRMNNMTST